MTSESQEMDSDDEPDPVVPRVRKYQDGPGDHWQVFFRPKRKHLHALRISEDLWKHYPGVTDVTKLHRNKLRVTVNNPKEANEIVSDSRFNIEYRVWIPARSVEIDGVVSESGLTQQQVLKGVGHFKRRNLPQVQILEVRQMGSFQADGEKKRFVLSNSYRVTFGGTALPDYIVIDNILRLPVRMYRPRVMNCANCKKLGHTKAFCSNKAVCAKCGENHQDEQCKEATAKCLLCGGTPHEIRSCPKYKLHSDKLRQEFEKRSKRSFAEIVKASKNTTATENAYAVLTEEQTGPEPNEHSAEELVFNWKGGVPKRKRKLTNQPEEKVRPSKGTLPRPSTEDLKREFPQLSPKRKVIAPADKTNPDLTQKVPRIQFSKIVEAILSCLSSETRKLIDPLIPFIYGISRILSENTAVSTIISFDL